MPRQNNLTDAGRQKAAAQTKKITRDRKDKRQAKVLDLLAQGKQKGEIARLLGVRPETISRDVRELELPNRRDSKE